jgi:BirA family transcriptional regulator, biotin operon repressor / biotin---[acetyl-CoA-carboxylase] ligase
MSRAAELAAEGAPEGTIVLADHQTAGRGRLGRVWTAPPGSSLMLSVVLRPALPPARAWAVAAVAGVALADAALALGVPGVALKWPNDLLLGGRKAAGLLAEARTGVVLLGMGVNVTQTAADLPAELRARATSLSAAAGRPVERAALLAAWGMRFEAGYRDLVTGGRALLPAWRAHLATLGQEVRVDRVGRAPLTGRAVDVGPGGELIVRLPDGAMATVSAGDVEHLRVPTA